MRQPLTREAVTGQHSLDRLGGRDGVGEDEEDSGTTDKQQQSEQDQKGAGFHRSAAQNADAHLARSGGRRHSRIPTPVPQARSPQHGPAMPLLTRDPTDAPPAALAATLPRTLVLIGLMGAGKSSVGKRLALQLGVPFRDSDAEIEAAAGMSVSDIFAREGEAAFRRAERDTIAQLLAGPPHVLGTGGGAFMDTDTRALIRGAGLSVWLRAELDVLVRRCARKETRPLLRTGDPRVILAELMARRYPVYAEADLTVDTADTPVDTTVAAVLSAIRPYLVPGVTP